MIESPPDFEKDPERWYRWAFSRYPLTHKDKLDLNRRARAHGLPDLWPEAEVKTAAGHLVPAPDWYFGIGFPQTPYWGVGGGPLYGFTGLYSHASQPPPFVQYVPTSTRFGGWLGDLIWPEVIVEVIEATGEAASGLFRRLALRMSGR